MGIAAAIFLVAFFIIFAIAVSLSIRHTVNVAKSQHKQRQAATRLMLELNPLYQSKIEAERRYHLELLRLQQAHTIDLIEVDLKRYLGMHRADAENLLVK